MADPRLQWRPLQQAQPNVAGLMRNSSLAFNEGIGAASSILENYDKGRKAIGDKEAAHRLAGLNDEAEMDDFLAKGGLKDLNVSDQMLANLGKSRKDVLGYENDRSVTNGRDVRTGIAQGDFGLRQNADSRARDVHGVLMEDERFRQGRRGEMAGLSGAVVGARTEGQDFGENGAPQTGIQAQVMQGMLDRGFPQHIAEGFMMNFQDESGFNPNVTEAEANKHGTKGKGLYQLTGPRRDAFEAKYGNDYSIDNQLDFLVEELATTEGRAKDAIFNSQNAGEAGANIVNTFLRPAEEHARNRTAKYTGANGFTLPAQTRATPKRDALEQRLAESSFLSPADINGLLDTNDAFVAQGTSAADEARRKEQEDIIAQLTMDAVGNADNTTPSEVQAEVQRRLEASDKFDSSEILNGTKAAEEIIAGSAGIQDQLNPAVADDVRIQNTIDATGQDMTAALQATPQGRMMTDIQKFSEDPTTGLEQELGLDTDGQGAGVWGAFVSGGKAGYDKNDLKSLIRKYGADNGVSDAVAAAAMRQAFIRDPTSFLGGNANILENRFPAATVKKLIEENYDQESISKFQDDGRQRAEINQKQMNISDRIRELEVQAEKDPSRKREAEQEISELIVELSNLRTGAQELFRGGGQNTQKSQ